MLENLYLWVVVGATLGVLGFGFRHEWAFVPVGWRLVLWTVGGAVVGVVAFCCRFVWLFAQTMRHLH
jgi:hypothetical protein